MLLTFTCPVTNGVEAPFVSTTCSSVQLVPSFSFERSRGTASTYATCVPSGEITASVTTRSFATCCGVNVSWAVAVKGTKSATTMNKNRMSGLVDDVTSDFEVSAKPQAA